MSELVCKCGHRVKNHSIFGCVECGCGLTAIPATHAAQRAAAIKHLQELAKNRKMWVKGTTFWHNADAEYRGGFDAYRAVGILKAPKP